MNKLTVADSLDNWRRQVKAFLDHIESVAAPSGWRATYSHKDVRDEPTGTGVVLDYEVPVLELNRTDSSGSEQRVTFEPRRRFTLGAAGQIDVYSYPALRDAMLLRKVNLSDPKSLSWEDLENQIGSLPWRAFSSERLPLAVDFGNDGGIREFLEELVA